MLQLITVELNVFASYTAGYLNLFFIYYNFLSQVIFCMDNINLQSNFSFLANAVKQVYRKPRLLFTDSAFLVITQLWIHFLHSGDYLSYS